MSHSSIAPTPIQAHSTDKQTRPEHNSWQYELKHAICDWQTLFKHLELDLPAPPQRSKFPLRVPLSFVRRMQAGNPRDPLLLQVLPQASELKTHPSFITDPLEEKAAAATAGLLHKFHGRVLLTLTGACAIHCRYCFRQHFPYNENSLHKKRWQAALDYIASRNEIKEVILSGGDPLVLNNDLLLALQTQLEKIPHLTTLRIHSRLPVVIPKRIDSGLVDLLKTGRLAKVMVLHCNHPQEINLELQNALQTLRRIPQLMLLNQSVLLKKINDHTDILSQLSEKLFACGVMPYYLHMPDKTHGTQHFDICEDDAQRIMWQLHKKLPGYLIPKLVREIPGMPSKIPLHISSGT